MPTRELDLARRILDAIVELLRRALILLRESLAALAGRWPDLSTLWSLDGWWSTHVNQLNLTTTPGDDQAIQALRGALSMFHGKLSLALESAATTGTSITEAITETGHLFRADWEARARRIATIETTRARALDQLGSPEASRPGAGKEWVTSKDERVRSTHRAVDGTVIPINGTFQVGLGHLLFPGDPQGPPEEIFNCRCSVRIVPGGRS